MLFNCDNIELLKQLKQNNQLVDLIYIDPPFNTGRIFSHNKTGKIMYKDNKNGRQYLDDLKSRFVLMHDILNVSGVFCVHCDYRKSHRIRVVLDEIFGEDNFVNEIIWQYKSGGSSNHFLARKHDTIFVYSKTNKYTFNPIKEKSYNRQYKPYRFKGVKEYQDEIGWYTLVNMRDVWDIPMLGRTDKDRTGYPTQKPTALLSRIIQIFSNENDVVADFYCGSGTTLVAAKVMKRKFIGSDVNSDAINIAQKRLM